MVFDFSYGADLDFKIQSLSFEWPTSTCLAILNQVLKWRSYGLMISNISTNFLISLQIWHSILQRDETDSGCENRARFFGSLIGKIAFDFVFNPYLGCFANWRVKFGFWSRNRGAMKFHWTPCTKRERKKHKNMWLSTIVITVIRIGLISSRRTDELRLGIKVDWCKCTTALFKFSSCMNVYYCLKVVWINESWANVDWTKSFECMRFLTGTRTSDGTSESTSLSRIFCSDWRSLCRIGWPQPVNFGNSSINW